MEKKSKTNSFFAIIERLIQNRWNMLKLDVVEGLSLFFASLFFMLVLGACVAIVLLFLAIALALYLNEVLSSGFLGFLLVSVVFLLLLFALVFISSRRGYPFFTDTFVKLFVRLFYDEKKD